MKPGMPALIFAGLLLSANAEQQRPGDQKPAQHQDTGNPSTVPQSPYAQAAQKTEKRCYPGSQPGVSCDGISAQAAVDQARDSDKQAALGWWQFGVGGLTLAAAVAAALYARVAAIHTRRSADAANTANRPWLSLKIVGITSLNSNDEGITAFIEVEARNLGNSPATNLFVSGALSAYPVRAGTHIWTPDCNERLRRQAAQMNKQEPDGIGLIVGPGEQVKWSAVAGLSWSEYLDMWSAKGEVVTLDGAVSCHYRFADQIGYSEVGCLILIKDSDRRYFPTEIRSWPDESIETQDNLTGAVS